MTHKLTIKPAPIVIGAIGLEGLFQCLRIIVTAAVEKYEPRVKVESISFTEARTTREDLMEGRAYPILRFELREGVEL